MNIDPFLAWVESTALSQWVVGSMSMFGFPGILSLHAIGMGFAVGIIGRRAFDDSPERGTPADPASSRILRRLAVASIVCWTGAIAAGRLLAYTYSRLTVSD